MKIAICASEAAPYAKSGGLGDVMEALPKALAAIEGNEVALFLPYYNKIKINTAILVEKVAQFRVQMGWRQQYAALRKLLDCPRGFQVYFIDNDYYFGTRTGSIYGDMDDGERFAYFSKACLDAILALDYTPDVIQCNDWQTAMIPVYLKATYHTTPLKHTRCMYTIHNIEYQGWANASFFDDVLGLPWEYRGCMDMNGSVNMMKGAIETADLVTTVSETYARELMYPYYAHGLDGILARNAWKLTGITNGIDTKVFNPETDRNLPAKYSAAKIHPGKTQCKTALQKELGLPVNPDIPMMIMITRLAGHKGLDLLCYIARRLMWEENAQLVLIGTGEAQYETFFRELEEQFPEQVSAQITFNVGLAARVYAAGDIYLMPSKSEPCGLSQMNAMRYGTVPVAHATGGLKDTVPPCDEAGHTGLGFTFQSYNADDFYGAVKRCLNLYENDRAGFEVLRKRDMEQDFGWDKPAEKYMDAFRKMLSW